LANGRRESSDRPHSTESSASRTTAAAAEPNEPKLSKSFRFASRDLAGAALASIFFPLSID
jgi:hypothetical protein